MLRGLFITGTDTGVGKTTVAAALMHRFRNELPLRYWKPIQTGIEEDDDTVTVRELGGCSQNEILDEGIRLKKPLSPHLAAKLSRKKITLEQAFRPLLPFVSTPRVSWIIEGAGGILVPINDSEHMVDLARMLSLPVLVVVSTKLGTINHTLLTLEALRRRALIVAGIVMVGEHNPQNRQAIEDYGTVSVLGEMPHFSNLNAKTLAQWAISKLDEDGILVHHLSLAHHTHSHFNM